MGRRWPPTVHRSPPSTTPSNGSAPGLACRPFAGTQTSGSNSPRVMTSIGPKGLAPSRTSATLARRRRSAAGSAWDSACPSGAVLQPTWAPAAAVMDRSGDSCVTGARSGRSGPAVPKGSRRTARGQLSRPAPGLRRGRAATIRSSTPQEDASCRAVSSTPSRPGAAGHADISSSRPIAWLERGLGDEHALRRRASDSSRRRARPPRGTASPRASTHPDRQGLLASRGSVISARPATCRCCASFVRPCFLAEEAGRRRWWAIERGGHQRDAAISRSSNPANS